MYTDIPAQLYLLTHAWASMMFLVKCLLVQSDCFAMSIFYCSLRPLSEGLTNRADDIDKGVRQRR